MTCDRLHILTSVACLPLCQLSSIFIRVVIIYITVQLFILLFGFLYLQLFFLLFMHCLSARAVPFTHTLTRSRSDDPGFARPDIGRFVPVVQVFDETVRLARNQTLSLF